MVTLHSLMLSICGCCNSLWTNTLAIAVSRIGAMVHGVIIQETCVRVGNIVKTAHFGHQYRTRFALHHLNLRPLHTASLSDPSSCCYLNCRCGVASIRVLYKRTRDS
jgi:hypothetical protein